jgi:peptidoglycan/LPS O-acetylase OafA/YrhL
MADTSIVVPDVTGSSAPTKRRTVWALLWPESGAVSPIPALDGLRAVAVILVILFHSWSDIPDGGNFVISPDDPNPFNSARTGVQLFFVLSGFLLFLPYARWLFGVQSRPSARLFYTRRILRVGPAYWVSLIILVVVAGSYTLPVIADALFHAVFLFNFSAATVSTFNTVFWTLAVEFQFYIILPLLGWLLLQVSRRTRPAIATVLLVLGLGFVSLACEQLDLLNQQSHRITFDTTGLIGTFSLSSWIGIFAVGIGCSVFYTYLTKVAQVPAQRTTHILGSLTFLAGAGVALAIAFIPLFHQVKGKFLIFGWAYGACLIGLLLGFAILRRPFESRPMRFIGLISYSIYLWHSILLARLEEYLPAFGNAAVHIGVRIVLGLILSVAVAYISYQLAERPFIRARKTAHDRSGQDANAKSRLMSAG